MREDIRQTPPAFRVALGVIFSVSTTLMLMWTVSRFPNMQIPEPYWIFGALCPALISTPVCILLVRQGEQNLRLSRELRAAFEALERIADLDQMTGLINRATFFQQARAAFAESGGGTFLLIDIDRFKQINDNFGHDTGDRVLQLVAATLVAGLGSADMGGRIGGEEFAIYLAEEDPVEARRIAEDLRAAVEALRIDVDPGGQVCPTVSIGIASAREVSSVEEALRRADQAMYSAKRNGRNRIQVAT